MKILLVRAPSSRILVLPGLSKFWCLSAYPKLRYVLIYYYHYYYYHHHHHYHHPYLLHAGYLYIQAVTGGTDQTSGECSLGHTIPI